MILDALLQFSNAQSIAAVASTLTSTNVIDLGLGTTANPAIPSDANGGGARDLGIGNSDSGLRLLAEITTAVTSGGAATLQVVLLGAPDSGNGTPGTFVTWWSSPVYTLAQLDLGARLFDIDFPRPPQGVPVPRFLELQYIIGTATTTAGAISSYIVGNRDDQMYNASDNSIIGGYPAGITVPN